jgi:hypothetical protein
MRPFIRRLLLEMKPHNNAVPSPLINNLRVYYPFNEVSGDLVENITNGLSLTDVNSVSTASGKVYSTARDYAKISSQYHTRPVGSKDAVLSPGDTDFTFSVWVYLKSKTTDNPILSKFNNADYENEYVLRYQQSTDRFRWVVFDGRNAIGAVNAISFGSPSINTWYLITVTHSAATNQVSIQVDNGVIDYANTTGAAGKGTQTSLFKVGYYTVGPVYADAVIGPMYLWSSASGAGGVLSDTLRTLLWSNGNGTAIAKFLNWFDGLVKYPDPIVLNGNGSGWKSTDVGGVNVFHDTPNSRWVLNFGGWGAIGQTGLAYNSDITNHAGWVEEPTNPIFSPNTDFGESTMASNGSMLYKDGTYYFAYQTIKATKNRICLATGNDLLSLSRANSGSPIVVNGSAGTWDENQQFDPMLRLSNDGTTLQLFYAGESTGTVRGIGLATSIDNGVNWVKQGEIIPPLVSTYNFGEPSCIFEGTRYTITADYAPVSGIRVSSQYITVDGGVSFYGPRVILQPGAGTWDETQVFDGMGVIYNGVLYYFYAGAIGVGGGTGLDMQIGVATMNYTFQSP